MTGQYSLLKLMTLLLMLLLVVGRVQSYSDGAPVDSCHSMEPHHQDPDSHTLVSAVSCHSHGDPCSGLQLTVVGTGASEGRYSCDSEYEGS